MFICYLRSSSYSSHQICPLQYYLVYTLGFSFPGNIAADRGNITHKALEILGNKKLAIQNGKDGYEDEIFGYLKNSETDWRLATDLAYDYYTKIAPDHKWDHKKHKQEAYDWTEQAMTMNGGVFNPENLDIIAVEKTFDYTFEEDWAWYSYDIGEDKPIEGFLSIKGTIDVIYRENESVISMLDWKTGRCWDWAKDKPKTYSSLKIDPQLMIYFFALSKCYPEAEQILVNIIFMNTAGAFTLPYEKKDLAYAKEIIRNKFEKIKNTNKPIRNKNWKCDKGIVCKALLTPYKDSGKSYCDFFHDQIRAKGSDQVFREFGDKKKLNRYGTGGGRAAEIKD